MALDPSIILSGRPAPNAIDSQGRVLKLRQLQTANDEAERGMTQRDTLANLYRDNTDAQGNVNAQGITTGLAQAGMGDQIPEFQTGQANYQKAVAGMNAQQVEFHKKQLDAVNGSLSALLAKPNVTHDDVIGQISSLVDNGIIDNAAGAAMVKQLPGPDQLRPWLTQKAIEGLDQAKRLELTLPKYDEQDRGDVINQGTVNPLTGQRTAGANVKKGATPGQSIAAAGRVTFGEDEGNLMAALAERGVALPAGLRSRDQMKATFRGLLDRNAGQTVEQIAEKIASGQIGFGADRATRAAAEKDFATGKSGQMLRSIGTANKHLTMLDGMVDALGNGDTQLINKLGNAWAKQTGSAAPNSFDAVKQIVGQEVVKAIVAGGGGVNEREEAGHAISNAGSPAQLKDVIARYRQIMDAQRESLIQQHRAIGLPDSSIPDYTEGASGIAPTADVPPDIAALLAKHGSK